MHNYLQFVYCLVRETTQLWSNGVLIKNIKKRRNTEPKRERYRYKLPVCKSVCLLWKYNFLIFKKEKEGKKERRKERIVNLFKCM